MPCRASKARLCVSDESGGADPQAEQGWGAQAGREAPELWGLVLARAPAPSPARPRLLGHPILARVSMNPAAASVQPQGMGVGGSISPQCHSSRHRCPPEWLGQGVGQAGPGSVCGQREAEQERRHLGSARPSADRCSWDTWHCPLGTATASPAPGLLTIPAAAAPGSASGRSSCQIHRC